MSKTQFDAFQEVFQEILSEFQAFDEIYKKTNQYLDLNAEQRLYFEDKINYWINQLQKPEFPIAFLGTYSVGKSTIINSLIFQELLPENIKPTTAFPTIIRKGAIDQVIIYFISETKAQEQKRKLIISIKNILGKDSVPALNKNMDENEIKKFFDHINSAISNYETSQNSSYDRKDVDQLKALLAEWDSFIPLNGQTMSINLSQLKDYIDGHKYSIYIDKIEVDLVNFDVPSGVVLVDLPGLAVVNERHIEFTKNYINNEAKAFVVCGKPDHLVGNDEIKVLEEINKNNPKILQRSFWVVNKWDNVNSEQIEQIEEAYKDKERQFKIKSQRFFKFSALGFYLATYLSKNEKLEDHLVSKVNDSLSSKIKDDQGNFNVAKSQDYLANHPEAKSFVDFQLSLFEHLKDTAIHEFIFDAKYELIEIINKLVKELPFFEDDFNVEEIKEKIVRKKIRRASDSFWQDLDSVIKEAYNFLSVIEAEKLWDQVHINQLNNSIESIFSSTELDIKELKKELEPEYLHSDFNFARLPKIIDDKIHNQLDNVLQEIFADAVKNIFSKMSQLFSKIKSVNVNYFPPEIIEKLEYKLGYEQMNMRLQGNMDVLFLDYGTKIQSAAFQAQEKYQKSSENQNKNDDSQIKNTLDIYQNEIKEFMVDLADKIDQALKRSVKNHSKILQGNLEFFLKDRKEEIDDFIDKQISIQIYETIKEDINYEKQRLEVSQEANNKLKDLKMQIQNFITHLSF